MVNSKIIFFRNDDVGLFSERGVSSELVDITRLFREEGLPISHGVVPACVNEITVEWLRQMKAQRPNLLGIDQHGYAHNDHGRGEFFTNRTYAEQDKDLREGLKLMVKYFEDDFSYAFTPPGNRYDHNTKRICDRLGFRVLSSAVSPKLHARFLFRIGRLINRNVLLGKHIAYHTKTRYDQRGFSIIELSVGVGLVEDYRKRKVKPVSALIERYRQCEKYYDIIGVNLHHWVFDTPEKIDIVAAFIRQLKAMPHISFRLMEDIAKELILSRNA